MPSNAPAMRKAGPITSAGWPRLQPGATRARTPGTAALAGSDCFPLAISPHLSLLHFHGERRLTDAEQGGRRIRKIMSGWRLGRAPWDAKMIKLADLIDNTEEICRKDRHFAPVYLREKRRIMAKMVEAEGDRLTTL